MSKVIILNDTSRHTGHIGCQLVMANLKHLCEKNGLEILQSIKNPSEHPTKENLDACDAIIINGEGTMHHDKPQAFFLMMLARDAHKAGKNVYLINTVWQSNVKINQNLVYIDKIYARESLSADELLNAGYKAKVVPDLSLYVRGQEIPFRYEDSRKSLLFTDSVSSFKTDILKRTAKRFKAPFFYMNDQGNNLKFNSFDNVDFVITGRFHGVMLCLLSQTPFVCLGSNTHKIQGVMNDSLLSSYNFFCPDYQLRYIYEHIRIKMAYWDRTASMAAHKYLVDAQEKIDSMFKEICDDIKK